MMRVSDCLCNARSEAEVETAGSSCDPRRKALGALQQHSKTDMGYLGEMWCYASTLGRLRDSHSMSSHF
jgi:hypothetical protein